MADIKALTREHLVGLIMEFDDLTAKKAVLLDAANGIASINVKLTDVVDEAQAILARYNTQFRTNFTLAQVRAQFFGP